MNRNMNLFALEASVSCGWTLNMLLLLAMVAQALNAQSSSATNSQIQALQLSARSALIRSSQPHSLTLLGTFTSTEGSLNQQGTSSLTIGADGSYQISLSRTVGPVAESRATSQGIPNCTWTDQASA